MVGGTLNQMSPKAMAEATAENVKAKVEEEAQEDLSDTAEFQPGQIVEQAKRQEKDEYAAKTARIDFGELQFGKDYEIL